VVIFGRTHCPYFCDATELLTENLCVHTHVVELNVIPEGDECSRYLTEKTEHPSSPFIFVKGKFIGGCEELFDLWLIGDLERDTLKGLVNRRQTVDTDRFETANLAPVHRGHASLSFFLHPYAINNHVTRVTALFIFALSVVAAAFFDREWTQYLAAAVTIDCFTRFLVGPSLSPLAMLSTLLTVLGTPNFVPGPAKQMDAFVSMMLALLSTVFFFVRFSGHGVLGSIGMGILALMTGAEGFFNVSLGHRLIEYGIQFGVIPPHVYRVYNSTLLETVETYNYDVHRSVDARTQKPVRITTDRNNPIALRYKRKSAEWRKDDFDPIRHMHVDYLFMPLSIATLSVAFRISAQWRNFPGESRGAIVQLGWFQIIASIAAFIYVFMLFMYVTKALLFLDKIRKEMVDSISGKSLYTFTRGERAAGVHSPVSCLTSQHTSLCFVHCAT